MFIYVTFKLHIMTKTIKHQFFFAHPKETVWEYLTKSELLEQWLMKNDFQPIVGHEFRFITKPIPSLNFDGVCHCKVIEIIPFEKLSYSWKGGSGKGEVTLDTVVEWKLVPADKGTELFLEHSGFGKGEHVNIFAGMTDGWAKNIQKIINLLNAGKNVTTTP
jgi:uncharacterized protein YndB with AHSA1/START domain